jgi:putative pyruvate formate lyase activating enzyme
MSSEPYPSYRRLLAGDTSGDRISTAHSILSACVLCPRACGVDRTKDERGFCNGGALAKVSSFGPHFGEESPLVGRRGSGTIFFAGCNLGCCFCQNYDISHLAQGREVTIDELALMMLNLQEGGCHNINLVTPTHFVPQVMEAVMAAASRGLEVPIVYNCGGYETVETLRMLEGVVDIYMPDFKFWDGSSSQRYCDAPDYPLACKSAVREMHRQVGDLLMKNGLAKRGLLVRHLVMPGKLRETEEIMKFLAQEISVDTFVNVMDQYRPCYHADRFPEIGRRLTGDEFGNALEVAARAGLKRIYT